jgi:hypothetical protein
MRSPAAAITLNPRATTTPNRSEQTNIMKNIASFFLLFYITFSLCADDNLIPNGDLGDWPDGKTIPSGFEIDAAPGADAFFSLAPEKHEGKNAIQLAYSNKASGHSRFISTPPVKLKPGEYELTFYVKGSGFLRSVNLCAVGIENGHRKSRQKPTPDKLIKTPMGSSGTIKSKEYKSWQEFTIIYNVTKENEYTVNFANNNREGNPRHPLMIARITLVKN